ncbi:MAG: serine/threonine-protein kinase PknG, partial [Solirubrobacteraceae bacterium]|nr:serine/threonine-protein kinase PknG [Solirubrobacteraceae bacterium]
PQPSRRTGGTTRTPTSGRGRLGAGLVEIPAVPFRDPASAVMADPAVSENRRFCSRCEAPVGRKRDGVPGRTEGFCRKCGAPFSFAPKLGAGDIVGGQYEVSGCLAHGGMGWIYLAKDRNVSARWVVLKGLLDAADGDAMAAALAERRFLAEVEHPNVVKIFNFVEHDASGYIVMEYVGGISLKQILANRRAANAGQPDPLPAAQAIAYMLEILPALGYLHQLGLLFCDFKVDNVIQTQHALKLIDLGGVYPIEEPPTAVFGTVGYQAPEIAASGPSISSDLFTVARTLAILCIDFQGYQSTHRFTLPEPDTVRLFGRFDSLYRFLSKATAPAADDRFQSADEMAAQLHGVLREVVAAEQGRPIPGASTLFTEALRGRPEAPDWRRLPRPQVGSDDPAAGFLATVRAGAPEHLIAQLREAPERTVEVDLRLAATMIEAAEWNQVESLLAEIEAGDPWEWRAAWYRGVAALARPEPEQAEASFTAVYRSVPGELAPKLALGVTFEYAGRPDDAAAWYEVVSRTDPGYTSAAFGLARCRLAAGDRDGGLAAYDRVPDTSSAHLDAQIAAIRCLSGRAGAGEPSVAELMAAGTRLEALALEGELELRLTAGLLEAGLALTARGGAPTAGGRPPEILGSRLAEQPLRVRLERTYRALARYAPTSAERYRLVDQANRVRPRTWT